MPHRRQRHVEPLIKKLLGLSPLVGVLGHRQVGKTTLLELLAQKYHTMDDSKQLLRAQGSPYEFIESIAGKRVAIDECQIASELFPALKEWVRTHPKPGQFLLSGSIRFTSRKAIQESLTGRIVNIELLPMLVSELNSYKLSDFWRKNVSSDAFDRSLAPLTGHKNCAREVLRYFDTGGLPGICFIREQSFRNRKLDSQIETILDRDLRKVAPTNIPYPQIRRLLQVMADFQGESVSWTDIRRETEISIPTLKKLVYGLEAVFLLRTVLVEGDIKGPVYFFEDLAELHFLRTNEPSITQKIVHFLMVHIRGEMSYGMSQLFRIFQFRTRAGVRIPIVLQVKNRYLGVVPIENDEPSRTEMAAAESFLKNYNHSKAMFVHIGSRMERLNDRVLIVPLSQTV